MKVYLDSNATTKIDDRVIEKMLPFLYEEYGNPGSTHTIGQSAKIAVDESREIISDYLNCVPVEVLFTSCATESNNWAIKGVAEALSAKGKHIISTNIEHSSIEKTLKHMEKWGYRITYLPVDNTGHVKIEDLQDAITDETVLVSIQYANSEIGTIMPVRDMGKICRKKGILFHTDATQAMKYLDMNVERLKVDLMTFAAHKINGPKAVASLYVKKKTPLVQFMDGGQQEFNLRAGTENVLGIVGFGEAVRLLKTEREERFNKVKELRDYFETLIRQNIEDIKFNGLEPRLPNISSIAFLGTSSDSLLARLDMEGVFASAGSACTSGSIQISSVLRAINISDEEAISTIRFSLTHTSSREEIEYAVEKISYIVKSLRQV